MALFPTLQKSLFLRLKWVRWYLATAILVNLAAYLYTYFNVEPTIYPVPFHISVYFGIDYTAPFWYYYFIPSSGTVVLLGHALAARAVYREDMLLAQILLITSMFLNAYLLGVVIFLVRYLP